MKRRRYEMGRDLRAIKATIAEIESSRSADVASLGARLNGLVDRFFASQSQIADGRIRRCRDRQLTGLLRSLPLGEVRSYRAIRRTREDVQADLEAWVASIGGPNTPSAPVINVPAGPHRRRGTKARPRRRR